MLPAGLLALSFLLAPAAAFSPVSPLRLAKSSHGAIECPPCSVRTTVSGLFSARMSVSSSQETASAGLLPSQRYMGVNRFSTRGGIAGAQWEEQWTHREYNMLARTGFRVSSLLRRTDLGGKVQYGDDGQDYMAMTVFDSKENFMDWKKKYSFNEAHAGGGPVGFVMSFFDTLKVLKGSPAGSGWEAPLAISAGGGAFEYRDRDAAGRAVSDGQRPLGTECFVHEERFRVPSGSEHDFEQLRNSMGKEAAGAAGALPGLAGAYVLRRDPGFGHGGDDGFNYAVMTVWKSEADYQAWEASPAAQYAPGTRPAPTRKA